MAKILYSILVLFGLVILSFCNSSKIELLMPDVSPQNKDSYLCTAKKLDDDQPIYITKFLPKSTKDVAHHILVYACENPGSFDEAWQCGEMSHKQRGRKFNSGPMCKGKQNIIYAWAMDAPELVLPNDVAFKLGAGTDMRYLVMQVHYANVDKFSDGTTDQSGIELVGQTEPVHNLAGIYLLVTGGYVRENSIESFESACEMKENTNIIPFAYRTHTHKLGKVNSGYLVRNDPIIGDADQTWTEIGRRSPQLPQMFYPVGQNMTIQKGDILAARCTIENTRDHRVYIGATGDDEMCNFYIMYYTNGDLLENNVCFTNGPPSWYFESFVDSKGNALDNSKIPSDINQIPDDQIAELKIHSHSHKKSSKRSEKLDKERLYFYLRDLLTEKYQY